MNALRVGLALGTTFSTLGGCPLITALDAGARIAASPCRSSACDSEDWLVVHAGQAHVGVIWPEDIEVSYFVDFVPALDDIRFDEGIVTASINTHNLRLAMVRHDGVLFLAEFGSPQADLEADIGAVGVGWSNAGDRLAVVTREQADSTLHTLEILTPQLDPVDAFAIELPRQPDGVVLWRFIVSWSADDRLVGISTDDRSQIVTPQTVVLNLADGSTRVGELANSYFIAPRTLVSIAQPSPGAFRDGVVNVFDVADRELVETERISGPQIAVASHPPTGVFATIEPDFPGSLPTCPVGLRTTQAGPDLVSGFLSVGCSAGSTLLIPLETGRPVLERLRAE
jgi:hypothetical protein